MSEGNSETSEVSHQTTQGTIRPAVPEDIPSFAAILAEAFPAMYRGVFGRLSKEEVTELLTNLYTNQHLSMESAYVCELNGQVQGLMILHLGKSIGRGSPLDYWRNLSGTLGFLDTLRAWFGGIVANLMLTRRIPHAPDLVYIEALAVAAAERNKGVGSLFLNSAMEWARINGKSRIALHVMANNKGAARLYRRFGFRRWDGHKVWDADESSSEPHEFSSTYSHLMLLELPTEISQ